MRELFIQQYQKWARGVAQKYHLDGVSPFSDFKDFHNVKGERLCDTTVNELNAKLDYYIEHIGKEIFELPIIRYQDIEDIED